MKIGVQLNPRVSIDKSGASLMPTLIEQVRVADQSDREVPYQRVTLAFVNYRSP